MGCATSKQTVCQNCQTPFSPVTRSYSMHVHHPPQRENDTYHVVALTSSTLGSLKLDYPDQIRSVEGPIDSIGATVCENDKEKRRKEFSVGVIEAKSWSKMIEEKIPKVVPRTPIRTPPGEPETINAWELMEGLDDDTSPHRPPNHFRSFSFHVAPNPVSSPFSSKPCENGKLSPNDSRSGSNSNSTSTVSEFDPDVISTFRKSLEHLPLANPFHLKPLATNGDSCDSARYGDKQNHFGAEYKPLKPGKEKLVMYFTSLRGVRKTYEDCCHVRVVLKGIGIKMDERDVSMHSGFKEELKELLGDGFNGGGLPRVFIGRAYIGGADEIRRMHEEGQLENLLEGCEKADDGGSNGGGGACEACGDIRFVPCETCSGSCKVYCEGEYEEEGDEEGEYGFQRCPYCNENGLVRCPICCG